MRRSPRNPELEARRGGIGRYPSIDHENAELRGEAPVLRYGPGGLFYVLSKGLKIIEVKG